jgi:hypothetical protein
MGQTPQSLSAQAAQPPRETHSTCPQQWVSVYDDEERCSKAGCGWASLGRQPSHPARETMYTIKEQRLAARVMSDQAFGQAPPEQQSFASFA